MSSAPPGPVYLDAGVPATVVACCTQPATAPSVHRCRVGHVAKRHSPPPAGISRRALGKPDGLARACCTRPAQAAPVCRFRVGRVAKRRSPPPAGISRRAFGKPGGDQRWVHPKMDGGVVRDAADPHRTGIAQFGKRSNPEIRLPCGFERRLPNHADGPNSPPPCRNPTRAGAVCR